MGDVQEMMALSGVSKEYPPFVKALDRVDLTIWRGQRVAILGPSGSGKSTLLGILGLLDLPTSGTYSLAGQNVLLMSDRARTELRSVHLGFVFQAFHLVMHLTAQENVELGLALQRQGPRKRREVAFGALDELGIGHRANFRVSSLSGGEQQRVAIARAIARRPSILLCDEPTGNLDSRNADVVLDAILSPADRTTIVVTHNKEIAQQCDRIITITDGHAISDPAGAPIGGSNAGELPKRLVSAP